MTQNYDDIFAEGNSSDLGEFFKFKAVGDKIAGTYIDLMESVDGYGNEQYVVVLKGSDGVKHRVSVRKNHTVLADRLKQVRFGQIVGFLFEEERESKMQGGQMSKIINIKQNPNMVDEGWIKEKVATDAKYGISAEDSLTPKFSDSVTPTPTPATSASVDSAVPVESAVPFGDTSRETASPISSELSATIKTLIVNKGLLTESATDTDVSTKVLEITGMELTAENGPSVINKIATGA